MSEVLIFVVTGLTAGAVYALAGVGLVLTYRTSGVFNFAHGALATVSAYLFYTLVVSEGLPWGLAALVAILVAGPLMGLLLELLARRLVGASLGATIGATVGVLLIIAAAVSLIYGSVTVRSVPDFLGASSVTILGTRVEWSSIWTLGIGVVATVGLSQTLKRTTTGLAMRAVVDDAELLDAAGTSPTRTRRVAWIIGSTFAAGSGVLFAPVLPLDPIGISFLVIAAFGAAAIGGFRNLPVTFIGGLAIGVLASLATRYLTSGIFVGVASSLPFLVLFAVLLVFPKRKMLQLKSTPRRRSTGWSAPAPVIGAGGVALVVGLATVPAFAHLHLTDWSTALGTTIVLLSLGLLVRLSGQVSLCHVTFMAIGAAGFSHLVTGGGLPWPVALVLASAFAIPVGAILAIPAIRLSGLYLALATFGFGLLVEYMFYTQSYMFGTNGIGLPEPRPRLSFIDLASDRGFYYVALAITVAVAMAVFAIERSRLGRLLRGVAEAPTTLETSGAQANVTRIIVFCLTAFMAALGGAVVAMSSGVTTADSYSPITSLLLVVVVVAVPASLPWSAIAGAGLLILIPSYFPSGRIGSELQVVFGIAAVAAVLLPAGALHLPTNLVGRLDVAFARRRGVRSGSPTTVAPEWSTPTCATGLELSGVGVRFGGVDAVKDIDLVALPGRITGLIGPNGAGKTTTFNACSGLVRPTAGSLTLGGRPILRVSPAARARAGLGRTFQTMQLFDSLSVRDNVALGAEAGMAGWNPISHIIAPAPQRRRIAGRADDALSAVGIESLADTVMHRLSTGQRRLVDLARCVASGCEIMMLDEPSSGLDEVETDQFGQILRRLVTERGIGILLVEHDLPLVLSLCSTIYVLDFGTLLFAGQPAEVVSSELVRVAYLGDGATPAAGPFTSTAL